MLQEIKKNLQLDVEGKKMMFRRCKKRPQKTATLLDKEITMRKIKTLSKSRFTAMRLHMLKVNIASL